MFPDTDDFIGKNDKAIAFIGFIDFIISIIFEAIFILGDDRLIFGYDFFLFDLPVGFFKDID